MAKIKTGVISIILTIFYIAIGLYLINFPFNFVDLPEQITQYTSWIILIAGVLMIYVGLRYVILKTRTKAANLALPGMER